MTFGEKLEFAKFIGFEFATWLCWLSHKNNGQIKIDGFEPFDLYFESPIQFFSEIGDATIAVLKGSQPINSPEACRAFKEGKLIDKAALRINYHNQTYTFTLNAARLLISGLRLPMPSNVTLQNYIEVRIERLKEFDEFFENLFKTYLALRCDEKKWNAITHSITQWIDGLKA